MTVADRRSTEALLFSDIPLRTWDVVVVGAGPAGAMAAREIARQGCHVLLVDRAAFPRWKVCGACLNGAALAKLAEIGLSDLPARLGARPLQRWRLCSRAGQAVCRLPVGVSLSREALDHALIKEAIACGAHFWDETHASLLDLCEDTRCVALRRGGTRLELSAKVVVAADGLGGRLLEGQSEFQLVVQPATRVGAGTIMDARADDYEDGTVYMACGKGGYVGLVRLEDGRLDVAAALDRRLIRQVGNPGPAAAGILRQARLPVPADFEQAVWRGTPALTCARSPVAGNRLLIVGDAAGYVEPFTGEGIAWALATGAAVAPFAGQGARCWSESLPKRWTRMHRQIVRRRQTTCRAIGWMLRSRRLTDAAVLGLAVAPWLARPVIRAINTPPGTQVLERSSERNVAPP